MRYLIRTTSWHELRHGWALELQAQLPGSELIDDRERDGWITYLDALEAQGDDDAWHFEDDVILTSDFERKARAARFLAPGTLIQGYDGHRFKESRMRAPGTFLMAQCFFLPGAMAPALLEFSRNWNPTADGTKLRVLPDGVRERRGCDYAMQCWLKDIDRPYFTVIPSLVQHRDGPSLCYPGMSTRRTSPTWVP
jgi:hypothetical protein